MDNNFPVKLHQHEMCLPGPLDLTVV